MGDLNAAREATIARATTGPATTTTDARRAAYASSGVPEPARALIDKVVHDATTVTDDDVSAAAKALGDDAVFELVICAAMGEASRQLAAAVAVLDEEFR